ncbi:jg2706 [Pararge aegeria aegeria]|uniref:Jg2706 protein n=1 Tax=Pararge aegeria aegeria TaxID=348720 RepID=A0A8S4QWM6_9NEOP|nr:jg2706 [Pararge aegeria aegeria]
MPCVFNITTPLNAVEAAASIMCADAATNDFFAIMRDKAASLLQRLRTSDNGILKKKKTPSACGAFAFAVAWAECPSNRRSGLQSEEPPHNTRRFNDYCLLFPTLDPTTKRKLLKMLVEACSREDH